MGSVSGFRPSLFRAAAYVNDDKSAGLRGPVIGPILPVEFIAAVAAGNFPGDGRSQETACIGFGRGIDNTGNYTIYQEGLVGSPNR